MHWQYITQTAPQDIETLRSMLLKHRGLTDKNDQNDFFQPTSPMEIQLEDVGIDRNSVDAAVARILLAKERGEEVVIFGDYDVDGVCSTAILWEALRAIGIVAKPFLPLREKHGYGLSLRSLTSVLEEHSPKLLITVDNGIVAHQAFEELNRLEVDTILTDHHAPEAGMPNAQIIVHTTQVCGAGVAWFLARALSESAAEKSQDLMGLATIADQMILLKANRSFVVHGIKALKKTKRIGLQILMSRANVELDKISSETINYVIAPRINAMGRLKHSLDALRLVCTTSVERASQLVAELNDTNTERQDLTVEMIDHALVQAGRWKDEHIIVVASAQYHEGVIGLLASKLVDQFNKPAIAISIGAAIAKASARSVPGVNIIELIRLVKDDVLEAGGHPMAAGFAAEPAKIELVTRRLEKIAREQITKETLKPRLTIESPLSPQLMTLILAAEIQKFSPFGQGNYEPIFSMPAGTVLKASPIGKEGRHLKMEVGYQIEGQHISLTCIGWGMGKLVPDFHSGRNVELAGCLQINEWKSRKSLQILLKDVRLAVEVAI